MELYAQAFDEIGALNNLEAFASFHGPDFYGLPRNQGQLTLCREPWQLPESYPYGEGVLKPLFAQEQFHWRVVHDSRAL